MSLTLYGIPNCDTVKKARVWLDANGIAYLFHDFRKDGLDAQTVQSWIAKLGWEPLVNRKGTTWRKLPEERRALVSDEASATALMLDASSVIKRPVLVAGDQTVVGFSADMYSKLFEGKS